VDTAVLFRVPFVIKLVCFSVVPGADVVFLWLHGHGVVRGVLDAGLRRFPERPEVCQEDLLLYQSGVSPCPGGRWGEEEPVGNE
jgi:hypothetical protein